MTARISVVDASNTGLIDTHAADADVAAREKHEETAHVDSGGRLIQEP